MHYTYFWTKTLKSNIFLRKELCRKFNQKLQFLTANQGPR